MKTIEELDWLQLQKLNDSGAGLSHAQRLWLGEWWQYNLKDKLIIDPDDLVEVVGQIKNINGKDYFCATQIANTGETHKALLIKSSIGEIEKDSFEKFVKDFVSEHRKIDDGFVRGLTEIQYYERAKRLLENS